MEQYLTIGELSKLSGTLSGVCAITMSWGILKPAYINKQTGYRYYAMEQLTTLSLIQVCNELDIPLKRFQDHREEDGSFALKRLVQTGENIAQVKNASSAAADPEVGALADYLADIQNSQAKSGVYDRSIKSRTFAVLPYHGDPCNDYMRMKASQIYTCGSRTAISPFYTSRGCSFAARMTEPLEPIV